MATSFKKKGSRGRAVYPRGTRPSLHNNQLLISSGVPSMDSMIGDVIDPIDKGWIEVYVSILKFLSNGSDSKQNEIFL